MLKCYVVKDLLPTYIDGLASEETETEVKKHLQECSECNMIFEQLNVPLEKIDLETSNKEINYLKKIKAKSAKKIGISIATILCVFSVLSYLFVIGSPVKVKDIEYTQKVSNGQLLIAFNLINGKELNMKTEYIFEKDIEGSAKQLTKIILKPYEVLPSPIHEGTKFIYGHENEQGLSNEETPQVKIIIQFEDDEVELVTNDIRK